MGILSIIIVEAGGSEALHTHPYIGKLVKVELPPWKISCILVVRLWCRFVMICFLP